MTLIRYAAYQQSGEEWLGDIPSHWTIRSIKSISPVSRGASPRPIDDPKYFDEGGEYAWVRIADVSASDGWLRSASQRLSPLGQSLSVRLEPGALFISIAGSVGKPCITAIKACIHDGFVYFPNLPIDPRFLFRIFEAGLCYGGLGKLGTQLNLNTDTIGSIRIALPPPAELRAILRFLDRETAKIDALVDEQKRLIELLKEKRQAVISHAVTKGLDPNAPMKDSGVEWLGLVPEHWGVCLLMRAFSQVDYGISNSLDGEGGIAVLRMGNIDGGAISRADLKYVDQVDEHLLLKDGDLLFNRTNSVDLIGKVGRFVSSGSAPFSFASYLVRLRLRDHSSSRFFAFMLNTAGILGEARAMAFVAIGQCNLNPTRYGRISVVLPPRAEQEEIAEFLIEQTGTLDALISEARTAIDLLQERRSALISAAVTGKIDVRAVATEIAEAAA